MQRSVAVDGRDAEQLDLWQVKRHQDGDCVVVAAVEDPLSGLVESASGSRGEVDLAAHGSQSSQMGILLLVAMFRVDPTAFVHRCAVNPSNGREQRIGRDESETRTRRCRARSRVAAIIRSRRHVYAISVLDASPMKRCSLSSWRFRIWLQREKADLVVMASTTGPRYCSRTSKARI